MSLKELIQHHKAQAQLARAELNAATYGSGSGPQERREKYYFHTDAVKFLSSIEDAEEVE